MGLSRSPYIIETHTVCYSNNFYLEGIDVFIESARGDQKSMRWFTRSTLFLLTPYCVFGWRIITYVTGATIFFIIRYY